MERHASARRFPLIPRPRPPCQDRATRIRELRELSRTPSAAGQREALAGAAEVCNKAALIASDCGLPALARQLCWRQHAIFEAVRPLPAGAARLALLPILNIPRQLIREGEGATAYQILGRLYQAARERRDIEIGGHRVSLSGLTRGPGDWQDVCTRLWAALLADGARALVAEGRWQEAAEHVTAYRGVGTRLLDGRQVMIVSLAELSEHDRAAALVGSSVTTEPWEQAVASVLRVHCCRAAGRDIRQSAGPMLAHALRLVAHPDPATAVFRVQAGLTAADLAEGCGSAMLPRLRAAVTAAAVADAHAAREVLADVLMRAAMTADQQSTLNLLVRSSGLGTGVLPREALADLEASSERAEARLRSLLRPGPKAAAP